MDYSKVSLYCKRCKKSKVMNLSYEVSHGFISDSDLLPDSEYRFYYECIDCNTPEISGYEVPSIGY